MMMMVVMVVVMNHQSGGTDDGDDGDDDDDDDDDDGDDDMCSALILKHGGTHDQQQHLEATVDCQTTTHSMHTSHTSVAAPLLGPATCCAVPSAIMCRSLHCTGRHYNRVRGRRAVDSQQGSSRAQQPNIRAGGCMVQNLTHSHQIP
jgi:hypothetical protein